MELNKLIKIAHKLDTADRNKIKEKNFALPEERKYPIEDKEHAQNALARVSQHGTPAEQEEVRKKVYAKYPELAEHKVEKELGKDTAKEMGKKEKAELATKAAALGFLDKIKLAHQAIAFRKAKLKVASMIIEEFMSLPDDVKVSSLLDDQYYKLIKEAFVSLEEMAPETIDNQLVGVYKAIENAPSRAQKAIAPIIRKPKSKIGVLSKIIKKMKSIRPA